MNCLRCEVTRAKLITSGLLLVGRSRAEIVAKLNGFFGGKYFVENDTIWRHNKPSNIEIG